LVFSSKTENGFWTGIKKCFKLDRIHDEICDRISGGTVMENVLGAFKEKVKNGQVYSSY
jgi:hypothetical protein